VRLSRAARTVFGVRPDAGAKAIEKLGLTGVIAAIGDAFFHATSRRIRDLPIMVDKLI